MTGALATVVFVDVERSTELLVTRGDEAGAAAINRVLSLARGRLADYSGREVKALGDGLMLLFSSPREAVTYALAVQRGLRGLTPSLRVGINTGEVTGPDPVGEAVTAAARIAAKAEGGEVLVSEVVRRLVGTLPGVVFTDRARVRLKGFPDRWRLFAAAGSDAEPESAPTFGRRAEQAEIEEMLAGTSSGHGGVLVVSGEGGIGKTHLVEWARARAEAGGVVVALARAEELDPHRPGRLLLTWADQLNVDVGAVTRDMGTEADAAAGFVLAEAVTEAVQRRSATAPVLVVAEDLQWADDMSLRGLASLIRVAESMPIAVILTLRPSPRPALLNRLLERLPVRTRERRLDGLDAAAVAALATSQSDAPPGPELSARLHAAGGNPLLVIELLRAFDEDGHIRISGGVADIERMELPGGLRDLVLRRVHTLDVGTVELLRMASLLGREFALRDLAVVAGQRLVDVASRIQPSVDGALLAGDGDSLAFRHDLLREAIYDEMLPAIRRDLHAAAGHALAAAGAPPLQVARQFQLGALPGDSVALDWLERAATDARSLDVGVAADLYQQVLDLAGEDWRSRRRVQIAMLDPLAGAGRVDEAQRLGRGLLDDALAPDELSAVVRSLAVVAANAGDLGTAVVEASAFAERAATSGDDADFMRCLEASMALLLGRPVAAVRAEAEGALGRHEAITSPAVVSIAEQALALTDGAEGSYEGAIDHARTARRVFVDAGVGRHGFLIPDIWEGTILLLLDDFDAALEALTSAQARAERRGELTLLVQTHTCRALLHHLAGDWDDGLSELDAARSVTDDYGNHAHDVGINALLASRAHAMADATAFRVALDAGDTAIARGRHLMGIDLFLHAKSRTADCTEEARLELLRDAWTITGHLRGLIQYGIVGPDLATQAIAVGEGGLATTVARELEAVAAKTKAAGAHAAATRTRGIATCDSGALLDAVSAYRDGPRRIEQAGACEDAALALFGEGRGDEAVPLLEEAAAIHQSVRATAAVARCDAALRLHGVRRRRARPRTATHGWDALSPTEGTVVGLIAQGQTNPEIAAALYISRRTVETHVSHIMHKLDVRTRAAIAAAAAVRAGESGS